MAELDRRAQIVAFIRGLPLVHRVVIVVSVLVFLLAAFLFFRWVSEPSLTVIRSGLADPEVQEVVLALEQAGIASQVRDAPTRVLVNRADRTRAELALSEAGVGTVGDLPNIGPDLPPIGTMTPRQLLETSIRRAHEDRLALQIRALEFVDDARVNLTIPEESLFTSDAVDPTASVFLETRRAVVPGEADSIALLVAGAVEGLDPTQISVVDQAGQVIRAPGRAGAAMDDRQLFKRQVELGFKAKVEQMLADIGARGTALVEATVNHDDTTITSTTYDPESATVVTQEGLSEFLDGVDAGPGGVPGVDGGEFVVGEDGSFTYSREITRNDSVINSVVTETKVAQGRVEDVRLSLLLDDGSVSGAVALTADQAANLFSNLVPDLNNFAVETVAFAAADEVEPVAETSMVASLLGGNLWALIGQVIGAIVLLIVAITLFLLTRKPAEEEEQVEEEVVLEIEEAPPKRALPEFDKEASEIRQEVIEMVKQQPEEIAGLVRAWLAEK